MSGVPDSSISVGAIILAAGQSTRMGQPKLLLPWGRTSILGHLIAQWLSLRSRQIAVVCAAGSPVETELDRLSFPQENKIYNRHADRGMFSSILCAVQWTGWHDSLTHWAIILGDQPHLRRETLENLLHFAAGHPDQVCHPERNGRKRHPVVLPRSVFFELAKPGPENLKEFLAGRAAAGCECEDPGLDLDIDRLEDYQKALVLSGLVAKA
jgi:molybdenum cofactor cytidylyltransferase